MTRLISWEVVYEKDYRNKSSFYINNNTDSRSGSVEGIEVAGLSGGYRYELLYSDLVVTAVIHSSSIERVPVQYFMPSDSRKNVQISIRNLDIRILEVLKGNYDSANMVVVDVLGLAESTYNYAIGDTMIMSLYYWKFMKGGSFMMGPSRGCYILKNGIWENQDHLHRYPSLTLDQIKETIASESIEEVTRKADVIVLGTIKHMKIERKKQPTGVIGRIYNVSLSIEHIFKGIPSGETEVACKMVRNGLYNPPWRKPVPKVKEGERWLLFLKHGKPGLYPFAGANGMFKVEGDTLIYNNRVYYKYKKPELEKIIIQEVHAR